MKSTHEYLFGLSDDDKEDLWYFWLDCVQMTDFLRKGVSQRSVDLLDNLNFHYTAVADFSSSDFDVLASELEEIDLSDGFIWNVRKKFNEKYSSTLDLAT